jgi:Flp pilus assembly protein TadB
MAEPSSPPPERPVPAVGEEIHLPAPSIIPLLNAASVAVALVGLTITLWMTAVGLVIFALTTIWWIRDVRRDVNELPPVHH